MSAARSCEVVASEVLHVVIDIVQTGLARTRVLVLRTAIGGGHLRGSVLDIVSGTRARRPLKGMEEAKPMANFVDCSLSLVIVFRRPAWHGPGQHHAPVKAKGIRAVLQCFGKVADAE